jgi:O-antigen/teichoic acid export membrane protein
VLVMWRVGLRRYGGISAGGRAGSWMTRDLSEALPRSEEQSLVQAARRVAANLGWLLTSQAVTRLIGFGFGTFLARYFGPHDYGEYVFVLGYVTYFGFLADGGLGRFLIREIARDDSRLDRYLGSVVGLRLGLSAIAYALLVGIALVTHTPGGRNGSIAIAGLTLFSGAFSGAVASIFDARQQMRITAIFQVIATAGNAVCILVALSLGFGLRGAFVAFALSNAPPLAFLLIMLGRGGRRVQVAADVHLWQQALAQSIPYAVLGVIGLIFFRIDSLMLTWIKGPQETGVYAAAYRLIEALAVLPGVAVAAAFPLLARLHVESRSVLRRAYFGALAILAAGSLPVALATWILAPFIIHVLYGTGAYAASVDLLRILSLALLIIFIDTANTMLLYSGDDLRTVLALSLVTTGANVGMNLVLIPRYGYTGAAWSTVLSELLSLAIFTPTVLRYLYR